MKTLRFLPLLALTLLLAACDTTDANDDPTGTIQVEMATDIPADPIVGLENGRPVGAGIITYYNLRTNTMVAASDSNTTNWDLALQGTTLRINGGTSGPGQGAAQVVTGAFEELMAAPADGYATDSETGYAISTGSGTGWYNYNPQANLVTPIPGRVLVIRAADGTYAKVRIVSYYKGNPATPDASSESRYYTFEYVHQPDGSRRFE